MEGTIREVSDFHKGCRTIISKLSGTEKGTQRPSGSYQWDKVSNQINTEGFQFQKFIRKFIAKDALTFEHYWGMPSSTFLLELTIFVEDKLRERKS